LWRAKGEWSLLSLSLSLASPEPEPEPHVSEWEGVAAKLQRKVSRKGEGREAFWGAQLP